ncbi:MAG: hypothetical protein ACO1PB_14775 [Ramlibacter sp.]
MRPAMVMFKAKFAPPVAARPQAQQQQQPQPTVPPIEKERGPQHPIKEPGPGNPPERAR